MSDVKHNEGPVILSIALDPATQRYAVTMSQIADTDGEQIEWMLDALRQVEISLWKARVEQLKNQVATNAKERL